MNALEATEWGRHYQDTFVRVKTPANPVWSAAYIHEALAVEPEISTGVQNYSVRITYTLCDRTREQTMGVLGQNVEVDPTFPKVGFFQYGSGTYYFERRPERQWKRSLSNGNCSLIPVAGRLFNGITTLIAERYSIAGLMDSLRMRPIRLDYRVCDNLWKRGKWPTLESASENIMAGKLAMLPIDYDMALSVSPESANLLLWKFLYPVAEVKGTEIKMLSPKFKQEVSDFFTRSGRFDVHVN